MTLMVLRRPVSLCLCAAMAVLAAPATTLAQERSLEVLHEFANSPGHPTGGLVKAPDGTFYGTLLFNPPVQTGGVFSLRPNDDGSHEYRLLHAFSATGESGSRPYGGVVLASDGHLYGTTIEGGSGNAGTIFRVTTDGTFTSLHSFNGVSGRMPMGRLVQGSDGNLYGTTVSGGRFNLGTIFRISLTGAFAVVHDFWWFTGASPTAGLVLASDGNFYGTSYDGGFVVVAPGVYSSGGTIFKMTPRGVVTPLYYFNGNTGGTRPVAALTQASDGNLYG